MNESNNNPINDSNNDLMNECVYNIPQRKKNIKYLDNIDIPQKYKVCLANILVQLTDNNEEYNLTDNANDNKRRHLKKIKDINVKEIKNNFAKFKELALQQVGNDINIDLNEHTLCFFNKQAFSSNEEHLFYNTTHDIIVYNGPNDELAIINENSITLINNNTTFSPLENNNNNNNKNIYYQLKTQPLNSIKYTIFYEIAFDKNDKPIVNIFYFDNKGEKQILNLESYKNKYSISYTEKEISLFNKNTGNIFFLTLNYDDYNKTYYFKFNPKNEKDAEECCTLNGCLQKNNNNTEAQNTKSQERCFPICNCPTCNLLSLSEIWDGVKKWFV